MKRKRHIERHTQIEKTGKYMYVRVFVHGLYLIRTPRIRQREREREKERRREKERETERERKRYI